MKNAFLVITSIAKDDHPILVQFAEGCRKHSIPFIMIGDTKSPETFNLPGCDFYSIERQNTLDFQLVKTLPVKHYSRKNIGYLQAISKGAEIIIETDDDNIPFDSFWEDRSRNQKAAVLKDLGWTNVYKYFSQAHIWPRGFSLEHLADTLPSLKSMEEVNCPIQQGLADINPDVDAIFRLTQQLPVTFNKNGNVALGVNTICPFNSQNTTWFREAFPLLYLPSFCSFRMTDIWRSFIAQRIAWTCDWPILFHNSTVWQQRNDHNLMIDFGDEISGYVHNLEIVDALNQLEFPQGITNIPDNMVTCYERLIEMKLIEPAEMGLLEYWLVDIEKCSM